MREASWTRSGDTRLSSKVRKTPGDSQFDYQKQRMHYMGVREGLSNENLQGKPAPFYEDEIGNDAECAKMNK